MPKKDTYLRTIGLKGFSEYVESLDGNPIELLLKANINPTYLNTEDDFIPYQKVADLYDITARELQQPSFGLNLVMSYPYELPVLGPVMFLGYFSKTPKQWLSLGIRHLKFHNNGVTLLPFIDKQTNQHILRIIYDPNLNLNRQLYENTLVLGHRLVSEHIDTPFSQPLEIRFPYSKPDDISRHQEIFGCKLTFDCKYSEIVHDNKLMDFKINGRFSFLKGVIDKCISIRCSMDEPMRMDTATSVRLVIPTIMGTGRCNLETTAEAMNLSPKTLQRRLEDEGASFSQILDAVRKASSYAIQYYRITYFRLFRLQFQQIFWACVQTMDWNGTQRL